MLIDKLLNLVFNTIYFAQPDQDWSTTVQDGIQKYFDDKNLKLGVLTMVGMNEALNRCVQANDDDAFDRIIE